MEPDRRRAGHANSAWCASEDDGARDERRAAAEEFDEGRDIKNHVGGIRVLHGLAVDVSLNAEGNRVGHFIWSHKGRTEGEKCIECFSAAPLAAAELLLPIARTDVVGAGEAEHVIQRVIAGNILGRPPDDDRKLAFEIYLMAREVGGEENWISGVLKGRWGFHEEDWKGGDLCSGLLRMFAVVQASAIDGSRNERGEDLSGFDECAGGFHLPKKIASQDLVAALRVK